ncbi:MAG: hypothetical protein RLZZ383_2779 [Pseudomonadota bacterium]|jgi:NAD+ kinase
MIRVDPRNATAQRHADALAVAMPEGWAHDEVVLVFGGDGFLLQVVQELGFQRTYLGINAGRIGFLLNDVDDFAAVAEQLRRGAWTTYRFPVLEAVATDVHGVAHRLHAVNDVVLDRATGQTAHLGLRIGGRTLVETLVADGVIVSTALGSTAYTFSAGGPACHPTLEVLAVTAICPHKPRLSPFLLPLDATIEVEAQSVERRPVRLLTDGRQLDAVVSLSVTAAAARVAVAWLDGHDHTARMVGKILRA